MTFRTLSIAASLFATPALLAAPASADQPPWHAQYVPMCVLKETGHTGSYTLEDVRLDKAEKEIERGGFFYFSPAYDPDCTLGPIWDLCVAQIDFFGDIIGYDDAGIDFSGNFIGIRDDGTTYVTTPMLIVDCPE